MASWVHKDSPFYELADLKGKNVSVPFGSAAHGIDAGGRWRKAELLPDFWNLVVAVPPKSAAPICKEESASTLTEISSRSPNCCHFAVFARKIYDGGRDQDTDVSRRCRAQGTSRRKYPEIVVAYIEALMEANDWVRQNPKLAAEKVEEWTKINKRGRLHFFSARAGYTRSTRQSSLPGSKPSERITPFLKKLNMIKELNIGAWVNDSYVRARPTRNWVLITTSSSATQSGYNITGNDPVCNVPVNNPREAGEVWIEGGNIVPFGSPACTFMGVKEVHQPGQEAQTLSTLSIHELGIKVFADAAFYSVGGARPDQARGGAVFFSSVMPRLTRTRTAAKLATYSEVLSKIDVSH